MNVQRAHDILLSTGVIEVEYEGQSVWIQGIDEKNATAEIGIINDSDHKIVSVNDLYEPR